MVAMFDTLLQSRGYAYQYVITAALAFIELGKQSYDLVICDELALVDMDVAFLLQRIKDIDPDLDLMMCVDDTSSPPSLVMLEAGVYDLIRKPVFVGGKTLPQISRALDKRHLLLEKSRLIAYLTQANAQIEAMNHNLEQQVAERTRQLEAANVCLQQLTHTDDVTGLYNQRFLFLRLGEEFRRAKRYRYNLSLIMADLDHFKMVNDTHDHLYGTRVLVQIGHLLTEGVRSFDFAIRYGGDEFVLLLPHTSLDAAVSIALRLRSTIEAANLGDENDPCHITISLGITSLDAVESDDPNELLRAADRALYLAKEQGRNRVALLGRAMPHPMLVP